MMPSLARRLTERKAKVLVGTVWNPNGLVLATTVPVERADVFATSGLGVAPVWHGFTIDQGGTATTDAIGAVGDLRLRVDPEAVRLLGDGVAWAPACFITQDGGPVAECGRTALMRVEAAAEHQGITGLVGHELEFWLTAADGSLLPTTGWAPYSLAGLLQHEDFVRELYRSAEAAELPLEQVHAEHGMHQFEVSLRPAPPVAAADSVVLARLLVQRAARQTGYRVSYSPKPSPADFGNGAHQHFSLTRPREPLFSGGDGLHGLTAAGAAAIGRVVELLPDLQAVLAGSVLSGARLTPGMASGAYAAWGMENREVAVRLIGANAGNPDGAHVEVKVIDPSASAYIASAAVLAAMLDGIKRRTPLPPEANADPASLSEAAREAAGIAALTTDPRVALDRLDASKAVRGSLGGPLVDAIVAGRRYELDHYGQLTPHQLAERFRFAW